MEALILEPLQGSDIPKPLLVIIDGLDELEDEETVKKILSALGEFADQIRDLGLKFLITSRRDNHIQTQLNSATLGANVIGCLL